MNNDPWLSLLLAAAPVFIISEMVQLIAAERFIGVKMIRSNQHPTDMPAPPAAATIFWIGTVGASVLYAALLLTHSTVAFHGACILGLSTVGFAARRTAGLKYGLVIMTLEGACRIGMLVNMMMAALIFPNDRRFNWTRQFWETLIPPG